MRSVIQEHLPHTLTLPDQRYLVVSLLGRVIQLLIQVVIHLVARSPYTSVGRSGASSVQAARILEHSSAWQSPRHPHTLSMRRLRPVPTRNEYLAMGASQPHCIAPGVASAVWASSPHATQWCTPQYPSAQAAVA